MRVLLIAIISILAPGCGDKSETPADFSATAEPVVSAKGNGPRTIVALPDPCEWLSASEAQEILGLPEPPPQTPMGGPDTAGRSCVYTNAEQTAWINVSYEGLNPQVFNAQRKSEQELIELASTVYAHGLEHAYSGKTDGYPTLAFQDADRTIMIVFTDIGKARNLSEGISERFAISSYYNVLMHLFVPEQSGEERLGALKGQVNRSVAQLKAAAGE